MALTKVSTDGVKDDAITKSKIPANQIEASELADNAVDTNAIANNAVTAGKLAKPIDLADNEKIRVGTGNDLEIYHDGNNSYLEDSGTGNIIIKGGSFATLDVRATTNDAVLKLTSHNDDNTDWAIHNDYSNNNDLDVRFNNTRKMNLDIGGNLNIKGGLKLSGDTAAANELDDYEEGTWTPSVTGGTITNSGAYYTKIGRVVHWYLYGYVSNTANDGNQFRIYGLPFTVGGNSTGLQNYYGNAATFNYTASANNSGLGVLSPLAHGASTYIYFHFIGVGDPNPPVNSYWHSHMLNQSFIISGTYFT